jgi:serine/threonine protein kinase/tetratricopeptide (TPR) repeat protein
MANKCPKCQTDNPSDSKFCKECATPLPIVGDIPITKTLETPAMGLALGSTFAERYQIVEELGRGGMGTVYKALDTQINEEVAIKLIRPEIASDEKTLERFANELKLARKISHKNVCRMYHLEKEGEQPYISMEYVEGEDLKSFIQKKERLAEQETLSFAERICKGLEEAHRLGVVHRDLKPSNIMIDKEGNPKIMDFGIARSVEASGVTATGVIIGTPDYISPEQAEGEKADQRSDIYSLGVILYEMVTGSVPFKGDTAFSVALKHKTQLPQDPRKLSPEISENLSRLILICMEKDRERRYQTAEELLNDLRKIEEGLPLGAKIQPRKETFRGIRFLFRRWPIAALAILVIAILIIGILLLNRRPSVNPQENGLEPISILVADFKNLTDIPLFDGTLEEAVKIGLGGASFINLYERSEAKEIAKKVSPDSEGKLDSQTAHRVSAREGISKFIEGSIDQEGTGFKLTVRVRDPVNPNDVKEYSKKINRIHLVLNAAAWVANKIRYDLGDFSANADKALRGETYTTSSLVAMNAYTQAQELQREGKDEGAIAGFLRAIEEDPEFGSAYLMLALAYHNRGRYEESETYFQEALRRINTMSEREKFKMSSTYYMLAGHYQQAIKECSKWVDKFPADSMGFSNLAVSHYFARNYEQAKEVGQRIVDLNPKRIYNHYKLSSYALAASDFELAAREARIVIKDAPNLNEDYYDVYVNLALANIAQGEIYEAAKMYEELEMINPGGKSLASLGLADIALYEGRLSDAAGILEKQLELDRKEGRTDYLSSIWSLLAKAYLLSGKDALAIEAADQAITPAISEASMFAIALVYIQSGKEAKALSLAEKLSRRSRPEPISYAKLIEGEIKKKNGKLHEAITLFQEAQSTLDTWISRCRLGKALIEVESYWKAHSALDSCLERIGGVAFVFGDNTPTYHEVAQIYYYFGRAQEGLSNIPAAIEYYRKFLTIKEKADPGIAEVKDARKRWVGLMQQ